MKIDLNIHNFNLRRFIIQFLSFVFFAAILVFTVWPWISGSVREKRTITLYGFSILAEVMNEGVFPAFREEWQRKHNESVEFISSFTGSGAVTNQILMGVPAEIAILSLEPDAQRLLAGKIIDGETWKNLPNKGILNLTPFIFLVRPDNPKRIKDFPDLVKPGVGIVHPDPLTSGGAQWAILAEFGSAFLSGKNDPYEQLKGIWMNVVAQASSARAARTQFNNGFGDVLITYEQEALADKIKGKLNALIIYPESTILSEHTVVVIEKNISSRQRKIIKSFIDFLWSKKAQEIFVEYGFRSVYDSLNNNKDFGVIEKPFTVADLGGWKEVKRKIIDSVWVSNILKDLHK